ncbi:phosphate ABC transporter permease [Achromatium sp. WMS2]|nr:phosphate ABC transporter permease [Achromatium sp. WMS2]
MSNTPPQTLKTIDIVERTLAKRHAAERRFKLYGLTAITIGITCVILLFVSVVAKGYTAFWQTRIQLSINFSQQLIDPDATKDPNILGNADYQRLIRDAVFAMFPEVKARGARRNLLQLISSDAKFELRTIVLNNPEMIGTTQNIMVPAASNVDMLIKGHIQRNSEDNQLINQQTIAWIDQLTANQRIQQRFNWAFFYNGDSRNPEAAGIGGALVGSLFTLLVTLALSFPIGVLAAIYLEEFAPVNLITDLIEVNINNLAAVPSIVFGLLGLSVFINFLELPRSAPLVGGLVLSLMTLPTIIIASRAAIKSVPPSIREAALGIGASKMQAIFHHVLPLALPGMLTGAIIGMARALGETAPLLMIGMVAFIVNIPQGILDPATVLPVQIYLWSDSPERGFAEKTSAAIIILLVFLVLMNTVAVILRRRFERRW